MDDTVFWAWTGAAAYLVVLGFNLWVLRRTAQRQKQNRVTFKEIEEMLTKTRTYRDETLRLREEIQMSLDKHTAVTRQLQMITDMDWRLMSLRLALALFRPSNR